MQSCEDATKNKIGQNVANYSMISKVAICLLGLVSLFLLFLTIENARHARQGDFAYRYNEVSILKMGINPLDAWHGKVVIEGYQPLRPHRKVLEGSVYQKHLEATGTEPSGGKFSAYSPWGYTLILPLSYLPLTTAASIWFCLSLALTTAGLFTAFIFGKRLRNDAWDGVLLSSGILFALIPALTHMLPTGNWPLVILAALVLMVVSLEKEYDFLAGLCWAMVMVKPQFGVLLIIPFVFARRWKVIATAVVTCLLLTIPAAIISKTSPITLIINIKDLGTGLFGCSGYIPWPITELACKKFASADISFWVLIVSTTIGVVLCTWACWVLRNKSWSIRISAVVICSLAWTYCHLYDYTLYALPLATIFTLSVKSGKYRCLVFANIALVFAYSLLLHTYRETIAEFTGISPSALFLPLALARFVLIPLYWVLPLLTLFLTSRELPPSASCHGKQTLAEKLP